LTGIFIVVKLINNINPTKQLKKGFTLIELLVVIAIIGVLATIVIVNVNTARNKGNDVAIKSALDQARSVAILIYDESNPSSYAGLCNGAVLNTAHAVYGIQISRIQSAIRNNNGSTTEICSANAIAYCVSSIMKTNSGIRHCIDSTGKVSNSATAICGAQACPN
jgi:prepilin-type N-terminal cleavage/methylation domain-containing protein